MNSEADCLEIQSPPFVVSYSRENLLEDGIGEDANLLPPADSAVPSSTEQHEESSVDKLSHLFQPKPDVSVSSVLASTGSSASAFSLTLRNKIRISTFLLLISFIFLRFYNFNINSSFSTRSIGKLPTVPSSKYQSASN
jgi:hypothetical protein